MNLLAVEEINCFAYQVTGTCECQSVGNEQKYFTSSGRGRPMSPPPHPLRTKQNLATFFVHKVFDIWQTHTHTWAGLLQPRPLMQDIINEHPQWLSKLFLVCQTKCPTDVLSSGGHCYPLLDILLPENAQQPLVSLPDISSTLTSAVQNVQQCLNSLPDISKLWRTCPANLILWIEKNMLAGNKC